MDNIFTKLKKLLALAIVMAAAVTGACAGDEGNVVDLVHNPDAEYTLDESMPLLEIYFPRIYSADACFIRLGNKVMMVDGGTEALADRIWDCIQAVGIDHVDVMFNSHPHNDHLPGLFLVAQKLPVGELDVAFPEEYSSVTRKWYPRFRQETGVVMKNVKDGDVLTLGSARLTVIQRDGIGFTTIDRSAMLRLTYGECSMLFAGDIEERAQDALAKNPPACSMVSDILKYPHHGQARLKKTFSSAVMPLAAVMTCGFESGRQAYECMQRPCHAPTFSTVYGILRLRCDGKIWVIDYLPGTLTRRPSR